jgi:hypothetical protein
MRTIAYWVCGLAVLVGSFLITNWILSRNEGLNWKFTDEASLAAVAKAAGYHTSPNLAGHVDTVVQIGGGKIRANGWAVDLSGDGTPITLSAYINGHNIATFRTDGPRTDITAAVKANPKASPSATKNTQFVANFSCAAGDKLFVVATSATKSYLLLKPELLVCP